MADIGKGDLPLLVLGVLSSGPAHGYAIAREIDLRSCSVLRAREGALYPALRALETDGLVTGRWEIQSTGPARKTYTITPAGRAVLDERSRAWHVYAAAVQAVVGGQPHAQCA